jgi:uncharacterized protein (TIGR02996 family)
MVNDTALLDTIIANPDEDDLRLVYADYFEEQGDPRAELIRIQIELDRLPAFDPRRGPLLTREGELLQAHRAAWLAPMKELSLAGAVNPFRRGILEHLLVTVPELPLVAELMKGPLRTVRSLAVLVKPQDVPPNVSPFSQVSNWTFISDGSVEDEVLFEEILKRCCDSRVRSLRWTVQSESLHGDGNGEAILRGIRSLGELSHLVELELAGVGYFSGRAMESLMQSPWQRQLRFLGLAFSGREQGLRIKSCLDCWVEACFCQGYAPIIAAVNVSLFKEEFSWLPHLPSSIISATSKTLASSAIANMSC